MKRGEQAKLIRELVTEHGYTGSKMAISKLVKKGDYRIHVTPGGKIKIPETIKALLDSDFGNHGKKVKETIEAKKGNPAPKAEKKKTVKIIVDHDARPDIDSEIVDPGLPVDFSKPLTLEATRATIEKHKAFQTAEKDRIANEIKLGLYHPKDEIEEKSFELFRTIRDKSKAGFEKAALKMRSAKTTHEARQIAETEHHKIFSSVIAEYDQSDEAVKKKLLQLLIG